MLFGLFFRPCYAGNAVVSAGGDDWTMFLQSSDYLDVCYDCDVSLECRKKVLAEACYIWQTYQDSVSSFPSEEQGKRWTIICSLIKGLFYAVNGMPLCRLQEESNDLFLVHAAVGALPLCVESSTASYRAAHSVLGRILDCHSDHLTLPGPTFGRLPLHIAATNRNASIDPKNPPSKIDAPKDFNVQVLELILDRTPAAAVSIPDDTGLCPLHLACANGFSWVSGLDRLFLAGPGVSQSGGLPSLFVLMAEASKHGEEMEKVRQVRKTRKIGLRSLMRKRIIQRLRKTNKGTNTTEHIEAVDTIFQLLSADPSNIFGFVDIH